MRPVQMLRGEGDKPPDCSSSARVIITAPSISEPPWSRDREKPLAPGRAALELSAEIELFGQAHPGAQGIAARLGERLLLQRPYFRMTKSRRSCGNGLTAPKPLAYDRVEVWRYNRHHQVFLSRAPHFQQRLKILPLISDRSQRHHAPSAVRRPSPARAKNPAQASKRSAPRRGRPIRSKNRRRRCPCARRIGLGALIARKLASFSRV